MTGLSDKLRALIAREGPIPVERYMALALGDPEHGYYPTRDPFGARGDFITAPEISQAFGELIGLWLADRWDKMGRPHPVALVEFGPGRGTLMADAMRAARLMPGFLEAAQVHLVETSPVLRAMQKERAPEARWHDDAESLPRDLPLLVIANEFFDALPIRQYEKTAAGWRERFVDDRGGRFAPIPDPQGADAGGQIPPALRDADPGAIFEHCPLGASIARAIAGRLRAQGGWALVIDYGHEASGLGDTLQALAGHKYADIYMAPGERDLTAHVDFEMLGRAARQGGARVYGPTTQGQFLIGLGIGPRAEQLKARAAGAQKLAIDTAIRRLIEPSQMGRLFKVMAWGPESDAPAPGF